MVIEVPSTGKNDDFLLISGILLALAKGTLISKKIKKNGKKVDYEKR